MSCELACAVRHSQSKKLPECIYEEPVPIPAIRIRESFRPFWTRLFAIPAADVPSRQMLPPGTMFSINAHIGCCQHCDDAPCLKACISGALTRNEDKIAHAPNKCVGCWSCIMICPLGAIVPDMASGVARKCDLCECEEEPYCVKNCPTGALLFENLEKHVRARARRWADALRTTLRL